MSKYTLLLILNIPFVLFGLYKVLMLYRTKKIGVFHFVIRLGFWFGVLAILGTAQSIYEYLYSHGLTDSTPLSIADVLLVTGVLACLTLVLRLYSKLDKLENRLSLLHEQLSIEMSIKK